MIDRGTYSIVSTGKVPEGAIVLDSRMIHAIKTDAAGIDTYKSRIVILGRKDPMRWMVVNQAPTLLRGSLRLVLTLKSMYSFDLFLKMSGWYLSNHPTPLIASSISARQDTLKFSN